MQDLARSLEREKESGRALYLYGYEGCPPHDVPWSHKLVGRLGYAYREYRRRAGTNDQFLAALVVQLRDLQQRRLEVPPRPEVKEFLRLLTSVAHRPEAKSEEEVGKIVVENVLMFDQKMWMRFASRSDTAEGSAEKTRIMELAGACMKLVEAMVEKTENTMEEASVNLQTVVGAAETRPSRTCLGMRSKTTRSLALSYTL